MLARTGWRVGTFRFRLWAGAWVLWTTFYLLPLLSGWFFKKSFDALAADEAITGWLVGIGLSELAVIACFSMALWVVIRWWVSGLTMLRTNMLRAQVVSGGPHRGSLPSGPAESLSRFKDDARDAVMWTDSWLDGFGAFAYVVGALVVLWNVTGVAALVIVVPLALVTGAVTWMRPRLYAADEADREAAATVSSFLGETFAAMLAFRLAGKEPAALDRLARHNERRRRTAVRKVVYAQALDGFSSSASDLIVGLMLVVLVPRVRSGELTIGDVALIVTYSIELGKAPRYLSRLVTAAEQARVSMGRMRQVVAPDRPDDLLDHPVISIDRADGVREHDRDPARVTLHALGVRGLVARYDSTGGGVGPVDLTVKRGEFVVVTGAVGSGKSTLLRALAGLVPISEGTVEWNGTPMSDLGAFMVPPTAAHLPQVPRLFSESLVDNIALGRLTSGDASRADLDRALQAAALGPDLDTMVDGLETRVGARGLRLSGGQAQRVAAARSLLTEPELLLVDDLSSAVDVETERALWRDVRSSNSTVIAVSHRDFVIDMADRVIELELIAEPAGER